MKNASPFVVVDNVKESLDYYQNIFGGETKILNQHEGLIMHAELYIGSSKVHFSGTFGGNVQKVENIKIIIEMDSEEEIRNIYNALLSDGQATVELQNTFFGAIHGQVTDNKNKICWVMNYFSHK